MHVQLSDHMTYRRLAAFTAPSIAMSVFTAMYGIVDGLFVSNFTGKIPFAALNLIWPFVQVLSSVGFMTGTGGSALVAKTLGEGDPAKAKRTFSLVVYFTIAAGLVLAVIGALAVSSVARFFGATDGDMLDNCVLYGSILAIGMPMALLQNMFQSFFATAEKPRVGLAFTISAGITNIVFDAIFVALLGWQIVGAAVATVLSQAVGGLLPLVYFARQNSSLLRLGPTNLDWRAIGRTCSNGVSEMMTGLAMSVVTVVYNWQLLAFYEGGDGVAAYGALAYMSWIFVSIFLGFSFGSAPIVAFNHGARNTDELKNMLRKAVSIIAVVGLAMFVLAQLTAEPFSRVFLGYDEQLALLATHGLHIYSIHFLMCGFNIFGSSFFTALGNGKVSAAISFMRTLVFETSSVLVLPLILGPDGIWGAIVVSEALSLVVTASFVFGLRKNYGYL